MWHQKQCHSPHLFNLFWSLTWTLSDAWKYEEEFQVISMMPDEPKPYYGAVQLIHLHLYSYSNKAHSHKQLYKNTDVDLDPQWAMFLYLYSFLSVCLDVISRKCDGTQCEMKSSCCPRGRSTQLDCLCGTGCVKVAFNLQPFLPLMLYVHLRLRRCKWKLQWVFSLMTSQYCANGGLSILCTTRARLLTKYSFSFKETLTDFHPCKMVLRVVSSSFTGWPSLKWPPFGKCMYCNWNY